MRAPYPVFDPSRIRLLSLTERKHDLTLQSVLPLAKPTAPAPDELALFASALVLAKKRKAARLFLCGAHVLRSGVQRYFFDIMKRGYVSGVALNGAGVIHDFEFALIGATTESVAHYIQDGRFGMWKETGRLNNIISKGWRQGLGIGESVGKEIAEGTYPFKEYSLFAQAWRLGIPVTVHVGIGYDIIHAHPDMNGEAVGGASYRDFLIFTRLLEDVENGCVGTFGSAVMAPEVFLKALSMVRNVAFQEGRAVSHFTSLVCDLRKLEANTTQEPQKTDDRYYFRPWKTLLSRTVAGGGQSYYVEGRHENTFPALWQAIDDAENVSASRLA